jgi:hypothetical protein
MEINNDANIILIELIITIGVYSARIPNASPKQPCITPIVDTAMQSFFI